MDRIIIIYLNQFNFIETFKHKNKRKWNVWFRKFSFLNIYFINYYFFVDLIAWQNSETVHLRCLSLMFSTTLCIVYTSIVLKQNRKNNKIQEYQCKTVDKNWKMIPSTNVNWECSKTGTKTRIISGTCEMRLLNQMLNLSRIFDCNSVADSAKSYLIWNCWFRRRISKQLPLELN